VTLLTLVLVAASLVLGLYVFNAVSGPYLDAFRFAFYLLLVLLVLVLWFGTQDHAHQGYDPTTSAGEKP